jgi:predicted GNAT family acetyltransferase
MRAYDGRMDDFRFSDNASAQRFELKRGDAVAAVAEYRTQPGNVLSLTHTEVQPGYEGQGVGSRMAKAALEEVRRRGLRVDAKCAFIAGYIEKHPEYRALLRKD